jgi:hypothetical protein
MMRYLCKTSSLYTDSTEKPLRKFIHTEFIVNSYFSAFSNVKFVKLYYASNIAMNIYNYKISSL